MAVQYNNAARSDDDYPRWGDRATRQFMNRDGSPAKTVCDYIQADGSRCGKEIPAGTREYVQPRQGEILCTFHSRVYEKAGEVGPSPHAKAQALHKKLYEAEAALSKEQAG